MSDVDSAKYWLSWIEFGGTIALLLVAMGVGYEFVADRLAAPLRKRIEIARETELGKLHEEAADANARAAEANLELARLKLPRTLTQQQRQELTDEMKAFSGQRFSMSAAQDPEAIDLVRTIGECLRGSSWEQTAPQTDMNIGDIGVSIGRGVRIQVPHGSSPRTQEIARALASALNAKGLATIFEEQPQLRVLEVFNVMVGTKPR